MDGAGNGNGITLRAVPSAAATVLRLLVMLASGILARAAVLPTGRTLAGRSARRIPALLSYAIAGTTAALSREALAAWAGLAGVPLWIAFGAIWGIVAGLLLPFGEKGRRGPGGTARPG